MRHDPDYCRDWEAHAGPPRFEDGDIPLRVQTEADLKAAADWALLAWEDPGAEARRSPFWSSVPMLVGEPDPDPLDPAPLLGLLEGSATDAAYARDDLLEKRRRVMQAWADCISG